MTTETLHRLALVDVRGKKVTGLPTSGLFLLVGHPKSGKTTLAASFPDSYILELEKNGADRVEGRIHEIDELDQFTQVLELVMADDGIKTIVIDSIDELAHWLEDDVAKAAGLNNMSEKKPGVDGWALWAEFRQRIEGMTKYFKESGKLVILIAHCKSPEKDDKGVVITPAGINVSGKGGAYLAAQAEMIGYAYKQVIGGKTTHFLTFQGGPLALWGSRVEELNDKTIMLSRTNPYSSFAAEFLPKAKVEPVKVVAAKKKK